jgi:hypothetical protein
VDASGHEELRQLHRSTTENGTVPRKTKTHNEEDPIGRQGALDATASAARYRDLKPANDCLESIDWKM